jgi:hypothetical protein
MKSHTRPTCDHCVRLAQANERLIALLKTQVAAESSRKRHGDQK